MFKFTNDDLAALASSINNGDISYLERRIANAKTEKEEAFWKRVSDFAMLKEGTSPDSYRLFHDETIDFYLCYYNEMRVHVKDENGDEDFAHYGVGQLMTTRFNFNGTVTTLEKYLDEIIHWDYDALWQD